MTEKPVIDPQQRLFNIMNLDGLTSSVYGTMQAAGASVNWVRELLGVGLDEMNRLAAEVEPPDARDLCICRILTANVRRFSMHRPAAFLQA